MLLLMAVLLLQAAGCARRVAIASVATSVERERQTAAFLVEFEAAAEAHYVSYISGRIRIKMSSRIKLLNEYKPLTNSAG